MRYKAYKYRLYPNKSQADLINKHIGSCRFVYNFGLDMKNKSYQQNKKGVSRFDIQKELPKLKKEESTSWLKDVNSLSLQAALACLDNAFTKFFKEKKGYPKFKSKKSNRQSFLVPQNTRVNFTDGKVFLPKFKEGIKCKFHRTFTGAIKTSCVSKTATGKYYISILVEVSDEQLPKKPCCENQAVGIDLGIKTFATLSDGTEIQNPKILRKSITKLKKLQKNLSKKQKGSKNYEKTKFRLAVQHEKLANRRKDFLEKTTHFLIVNYDTICLETLSIKNMMKNHHLAQALSDVAIGNFNEILEKKAEWHGVNIIRIGEFEPSSKMCSCGYIYKDLKLSQREWVCPVCGLNNKRDLLAANNIKKFAFCKNNTAGTAEIYACGDMTPIMGPAQEIHNA